MTTGADVDILVRTIVAPPATLGSLAHDLGLTPQDVARSVRALLHRGALALTTTHDHAQLAVVVGRDDAVAEVAGGHVVVQGWLAARRGVRGEESQPLRSATEFANVASGFAQRARRVTVLLPSRGTEPQPQPDQFAGVLEAVKAACANRVTPKVLIARRAAENPRVQRLCEAMTALGVAPRVAPSVEVPLIAWQGLGAVFLRPEGMLLGVHCVHDYAVACHDAGSPLDELTPVQVAQLLAEGLTDAVAARRLGMSERQFRRHVSQLQSSLGCTSRFQSGVMAARVLQW